MALSCTAYTWTKQQMQGQSHSILEIKQEGCVSTHDMTVPFRNHSKTLDEQKINLLQGK